MRTGAGRRPPRRTAIRIAALGLIGALSASLLLVAVVPSAHAAPRKGLSLGFMDGVYRSTDPAERALWLDRTVAVGADSVTLLASWRSIAGEEPADPASPADPAYEWSRLDAAVRDATARGLRVMITINQAPAWAEGPNRDPDAPNGSWKPSPPKLAQFARAIATRFSGSFPDPAVPGATLPRVSEWQVWAEPNGRTVLTPQWERAKGRLRMFSPVHYRKMLNAAYAAIKAVARSNLVIAAGTAPFGDYVRGGFGARIPPVRFWRELFCLRNRKSRKGCPVRADVVAHNPLGAFGGLGPWKHAPQNDDVLIPDMKKLAGVVRAARRHKTIRPGGRKPLWVTELLWETNPPDPSGVSPALQAQYLSDSLYLLWRQGVSEVHWVQIEDDPGGILQSGLYFENGEPKPSRQAFRFPFSAERRRGRTTVWGITPSPGQVQIQRQSGGGWVTIKTLRAGSSGVFTGKVPGSGAELRAAAGGETSLSRRPR